MLQIEVKGKLFQCINIDNAQWEPFLQLMDTINSWRNSTKRILNICNRSCTRCINCTFLREICFGVAAMYYHIIRCEPPLQLMDTINSWINFTKRTKCVYPVEDNINCPFIREICNRIIRFIVIVFKYT